MNPTWCTPTTHQGQAFQQYQECNKRHHGSEDFNVTNKLPSFFHRTIFLLATTSTISIHVEEIHTWWKMVMREKLDLG
jgi:hypothetical protein